MGTIRGARGRAKETREIDGQRTTCQQFDAVYAFELLAHAAQVLGPALAPVVPILATSGFAGVLQMDLSAVGAGFAKLAPREATALLVEILSGTQVVVEGEDGRDKIVGLTDRAAIALAFESGGLPAMMSTVKFALEVNFKNFSSAGSAPRSAAADLPASP